MSMQVKGITTIKNATILKRTLEELGIEYKEHDNVISMGSGRYDRMSFKLANGEVVYDDMRRHQLNEIKQTYSKNFVLQEIAIKGHRVASVQNVGQNIEIIASY
jgi:hypothetical protein